MNKYELIEGFVDGDTCNRNKCIGVIEAVETDGCCSCHIMPPCGYCVDREQQCNTCGAVVEKASFDYKRTCNNAVNKWKTPIERYLDFDGKSIQWVIIPHTHFTQICKGRMPKGTSIDQILDAGVKGTFGGRFKLFKETYFEYIAYTD